MLCGNELCIVLFTPVHVFRMFSSSSFTFVLSCVLLISKDYRSLRQDLKNGMASQASDSQKVIDDSDSILRRTPVYLDVNDFRRFLQPIPTYKG